MSANRPQRIGIVVAGYGYWGPNVVRNVIERPEFKLMGVCERDEERVSSLRRRHPGIWVDRDLDITLTDPRVEAVAIATPPSTHYELVTRALEAGKHVLVEKPLATSSQACVELIRLAAQHQLVLMPGHTFVYSPSVNKIRELIHGDVLGEVFFITSSRMNLGKFQRDGVVLDLAPHDLSILLHWLEEPLVRVAASGRSVFHSEVPDTAFMTLTFASGTQANVQLSWLAPRKVRQMVIVGSRRMVQYEDSSSDETVRVYDRGLDFDEPPSNFGEYNLTYRTGDMVAPRIDAVEPLALELQDFASAIKTGAEPRSSARLGVTIVVALEALAESLRQEGRPVTVPPIPLVGSNGRLRVAEGNGKRPSADGVLSAGSERFVRGIGSANGGAPGADGLVAGGTERNGESRAQELDR